ncbi:Uncharacterized conserved protein, DUF849 family [Arboricoccus pini]|uniref:Uncharacterized conserved protein, DUF849 family n=1 Tax=Arboricoccus pini TaxID=1963835 RepID=A0A212RXF8_9PROT|nr:3-keto-5-aminohexanoate cleavage protein [Arboricoccus pini]SNB77457.1 Uncharacterized conserved protein, DUF849 family [Arboricoccus pini]
MSTRTFLQAALNGNRDHPATPKRPEEIAREAKAAVAAGAQSLHFHPYAPDGRETFDAAHCAAAIRAVRAACPGISLSLSTSATIEPDPAIRHARIAAWTDWPDLVTANQGEAGIVELCQLLLSRGVAIEAGNLCLDDARAFIVSGLAPQCHRVMIEPLDTDIGAAVTHARAMSRLILDAGIALQQVHHGEGIASWAVNRRALAEGHAIRTGLEDVDVLPDGRPAQGNGELVAAAAALIRAAEGN